MNVPQISLRLRAQMESFLGNLPGLPKTARRFCLEALYGAVTRKSLHLSETARALREPIPLIKTENRLSRQAAREGLHERITEFVVDRSASRIGEDTLLVIDPSDISKKYAEKMEYLAQVRDGSTGKLADGYWLCQAIAVECGGSEITPLVNHLWSQNAPGHLSENDEILRCINMVTESVGSKGIWVIDRGGDRMSIMKPLLDKGRRFLIRMVGNRHVLYRGKPWLVEDLARVTPLNYVEHITKQCKDGSERRLKLSFGMKRVRLPGFPGKRLTLVVLEGFGEKPTMILTTEMPSGSRKSLWWIIEAYLTRWRIEETLRFAKQTYGIEDVRVLGYQSLRNMMAVALLAMSFTMNWLGHREKLAVLAHHAIHAAKRFFGVPDFKYYTLADGLAEILSARQDRPFKKKAPLPRDAQLDMLQFFSG